MTLNRTDYSDEDTQLRLVNPFEAPIVADESPPSAGVASPQAQLRPTYAGPLRLILYGQIVASSITGLSAACDRQRLQIAEPLEIILALLTMMFLPLLLTAFPLVLYFTARSWASLRYRMAILFAAGLTSILHWIATIPLVQ
jgi:hypothetical protein